ncbi:Uma2 family endonuclease [Amycolatopsis nigrescens]|uniref:Uma2 family endonuclease n=1 Tax=Amycolatopsis nigrescens TaxID=381445 RepID=UPI00035C79EF|nr:Uma2 family endonuclease [Amycolatopsis nigrescens]
MSALLTHDEPLSLADWLNLPEDNSRRYELVEGVLSVSSRPSLGHQEVISGLLQQLRPQLPAGLKVLPEVEVVLFEKYPPTVRVPDLVVVPSALATAKVARCHAPDVRLVVEVMSSSSKVVDRSVKFVEYAKAGIGNYWIIDLEKPLRLTAYRLSGDHYEPEVETTCEARLTAPAPVAVRPAALLP